MYGFMHEDDLLEFDGYLQFQGVDRLALTPSELAEWRQIFEEARARREQSPKVGLMTLRSIAGELRYAVAVRDGSKLWLTIWIRRSRKGEFFVMVPRSAADWDPHTSYHLDGTLHAKSYGRKMSVSKRQPLTTAFTGVEPVGAFGGYGPKSVGAICDPTAFNGVVEVPSGVLGPRDGQVAIDLVGKGSEHSLPTSDRIVRRQLFRETSPYVAITVESTLADLSTGQPQESM